MVGLNELIVKWRNSAVELNEAEILINLLISDKEENEKHIDAAESLINELYESGCVDLQAEVLVRNYIGRNEQ